MIYITRPHFLKVIIIICFSGLRNAKRSGRYVFELDFSFRWFLRPKISDFGWFLVENVRKISKFYYFLHVHWSYFGSLVGSVQPRFPRAKFVSVLHRFLMVLNKKTKWSHPHKILIFSKIWNILSGRIWYVFAIYILSILGDYNSHHHDDTVTYNVVMSSRK